MLSTKDKLSRTTLRLSSIATIAIIVMILFMRIFVVPSAGASTFKPLSVYIDSDDPDKLLLVWEKVAGAVDYHVSVSHNGKTASHTCRSTTALQIDDYIDDAGVYTFKVTTETSDGILEGSCNYERFIRIDTPSKVSISSNILSWQQSRLADSYLIFLNDIEVGNTESASFDLSSFCVAGKTYTVKVMARSSFEYHLPSTSSPINHVPAISPHTVDNLFLAYFGANAVLSWSGFGNTSGYFVTLEKVVDGSFVAVHNTTTQDSYADVSAHLITDGTYRFTVISVGADSAAARSCSYRISSGRAVRL